MYYWYISIYQLLQKLLLYLLCKWHYLLIKLIKRLISQIIGGFSRVLEKLLKYFNGTVISAFVVPALLPLFLRPALNLNYSESVLLSLRWSLKYCHRLPDVFPWLLLHSIRLYNGSTTSRSFCIVYLGTTYFPISVRECCTIFNYYFVYFVYLLLLCSMYFLYRNCYSSLHMRECITVVTETWHQHFGFNLIWLIVLYFPHPYHSFQPSSFFWILMVDY